MLRLSCLLSGNVTIQTYDLRQDAGDEAHFSLEPLPSPIGTYIAISSPRFTASSTSAQFVPQRNATTFYSSSMSNQPWTQPVSSCPMYFATCKPTLPGTLGQIY